MNRIDLIHSLVKDAKPIEPLKKPSYFTLQFVVFAILYYIFAQTVVGVRSDIVQKFSQPFFVAEIFLMIVLLLSCLVSVAIMLYPDHYQKSYLLNIPYLIMLFLAVFFALEFVLQNNSEIITTSTHNIECSICVAVLALIPAFYFFYILNKGLSSNPTKSGAISVITASTIGCLALRIAESQDLISHLLIWHYLPIIIFASIGATVGRLYFKW